jgi:hypothetical protein
VWSYTEMFDDSDSLSVSSTDDSYDVLGFGRYAELDGKELYFLFWVTRVFLDILDGLLIWLF